MGPNVCARHLLYRERLWAIPQPSTVGRHSSPQSCRTSLALCSHGPFDVSDPRRPRSLTPLGEGLPDKLTYTESPDGEGILHVGQGSFSPVTARMWAYDVSGMNVIKKWFSYRKANPGGKKTSPLDELHLQTWPREWITEFNELLTVLRRVTELEEAQAALLERVLSGPLITASEMAATGVKFPQATRDRKPNYSLATSRPNTQAGQETLI